MAIGLAPPSGGELTVSRMSSSRLQSPVEETSNGSITYTTVVVTRLPSTVEVNQGEPPTIYDHVIARKPREATSSELDATENRTTSQSITIETVSDYKGKASESTAYTTVVFARNTTQNATPVSEPQETPTMDGDVILSAKTGAEADCTTTQSVTAEMKSNLADTSGTSTTYTSIVFAQPVATPSDIRDHKPCDTQYEEVILPSNKPVNESMETVCRGRQQEIFTLSAKVTDIFNAENVIQKQTEFNEPHETQTMDAEVILSVNTGAEADYITSKSVTAGMKSDLEHTSEISTMYTSIAFAQPVATPSEIRDHRPCATQYEEVILPSNKPVNECMETVCRGRQQEISPVSAKAADITNDENLTQKQMEFNEPHESPAMDADVIFSAKTGAEAYCITSQSVTAGMKSDLEHTSEISTMYTSIVFAQPVATPSDIRDHRPCATQYEEVILPSNKPVNESMETVCKDRQQEIFPVAAKATDIFNAGNLTQKQREFNEPHETPTMEADVILFAKTGVEADCITSPGVPAGMTSDLEDTSQFSTMYTSIVFAQPVATTSDIRDHRLCATQYEEVILPFNKPVNESMHTVCSDQQQEIHPAPEKARDIVNGTPSLSMATNESTPEQARIGKTETEYRCIPFSDLKVEKLVTYGYALRSLIIIKIKQCRHFE